VLVDDGEGADVGAVTGVISYAARQRDLSGVVLWLHANEEPAAIGALVDHALADLADAAAVEAFSFATALGLGLEALPVRHRPVTADILRSRGFRALDLWRYMRCPLPIPGGARASGLRVTRTGPGELKLLVGPEEAPSAEADLFIPGGDVGMLRWLHVEPGARGRGLGRALLGSALEILTEHGAREAILYVDDDEPGGERDRTAALALYRSVGFVDVDGGGALDASAAGSWPCP
jgi:ribosomal protein S18 acetylase RimI-like enzyme